MTVKVYCWGLAILLSESKKGNINHIFNDFIIGIASHVFG